MTGTVARMTSEQGKTLADDRGIDGRLERQRLTFEAIFRLVEKLGTTFDVSKIASLFLMTLMGQLKVRRASLYFVVPEKKILEPYRSLGVANGGALASVPIEAALAQWLVDAAGPVTLDEFCVGPGCAVDEEEEMIRRFAGAGFSHAIALSEQGDLLGALFYSSAVTGEPFSDFDDEIIKMLARVASITIKNAFLYQAAIASKHELEQFSEVKREFITHTSHELRTPLTVVKSALWSLEPDEVDEEVLVDMAKDALTRLEGKVEYLLSLNDIELNRTEFRFEQSEVSSILEGVLREILPELEEKRVHVDVDDQARFRKLLIDTGKIKIVVRSILDNAIGSVGCGGNIAITLRVSEAPPGSGEGVAIGDWRSNGAGPDAVFSASVSDGRDDGIGPGTRRRQRGIGGPLYVVISVKDDGIGIPASEIATLAEPFTMASNSQNRNVKGLGIGLSVSQKIVSGHGGAIFCKSDLGQGAQFSVWLPLEV
jgi:signal transduction histidine kinase